MTDESHGSRLHVPSDTLSVSSHRKGDDLIVTFIDIAGSRVIGRIVLERLFIQDLAAVRLGDLRFVPHPERRAQP
ncbi:MAG: hypothetical protein AB7F78_25065 [Hyphomicrobiaceae bacterium]